MSTPGAKSTRAPRIAVAYVERKGPYSAVGGAMAALKRWLDSKGIEQAGHPFCLFYDNPGETPEAELRSEACIPVSRGFAAEGEFRSKTLGEADVAETKHQGPHEEFGRTYGPFLEGLLNRGYKLEGPAREYFLSAKDVKGPGSGFLIQQPISKR